MRVRLAKSALTVVPNGRLIAEPHNAFIALPRVVQAGHGFLRNLINSNNNWRALIFAGNYLSAR